MNNIKKLLFLHFEKGLVGLFGLGLLYSFVFYGPWTVRRDFSTELTKISIALDSRPVKENAPSVEDLLAGLSEFENVPPQEPLIDALIWPKLTDDVDLKILPPADVVAQGDRGYVAVTWEINSNQPDTKGTLDFIGAQVDRAVVTSDGIGPFENKTRQGSREYMTPNELYELAQKVASVTLKEQEAVRRRDESQSSMADFYSASDLFDALHDGLIDVAELRRLVSEGVRLRRFTPEDSRDVRDIIMGINQDMKMLRRSSPELSDSDLLKQALEANGFSGGGAYGRYVAMQRQAVVESETAAASEEEEKPKEAEAKKIVQFGEITMFVDTDVNPDQEYVYRVRFWAANVTGRVVNELMQTAYAPETPVVAPKPDTEFFLTGIMPAEGKASIVVKKWLPVSSSWAMQSFLVAPGEPIGRVVVLDKKDTNGRMIVDNSGIPIKEPVDFSTECVLLSSRMLPKAIESRNTTTRFNPETGAILSVDNVEYVLYDTAQIVYSDRKGVLRMKWKTRADAI